MPTLKNNPFNNIVAGSKAILSLPVNGPTYHFILLHLVSLTLADLLYIRIRLNQKIIKEINGNGTLSAGELLKIFNVYKGDKSDNNYLTLDFTELLAKELTDELSGIIPTAFGVSSLTVEISIKAGATIGTDELESWSEVSGLIPAGTTAPLANIQHMVAQTHNWQAANTYDVVLPHGSASAHQIKRLWIVQTSGAGTISAVDCRKNNLPVKETTKGMNDFILARYKGILNAAFYVIDFVASNHTIGGLLSTSDAGDLRLKVKTTGSVVADIYIESLADVNLI